VPAAASAPADLTPALLTTSDLQRVDGLPDDVRAADPSAVNLADNPDPRGPCGATITQPDLAQDEAIAITSASILGIQGVLVPSEISAADYLDANLDDATEGCPAWTSTTSTGSTQTVTLVDVVPEQRVPEGIDQQLGFVLEVEDAGQTAYAGLVLLRAGDVLSQVAWFGGAEIDPRTVSEVVVLAAARLASAL
jgi:hypothetical protein